MITPTKAKVMLKRRGWSQRRAARELGVTQTHLALVLNRDRISLRLLSRIESLPDSEVPYQVSGFALRKYRRAS